MEGLLTRLLRVSSCFSRCSTLGRSSSSWNEDEGGGETGSGVSSVFLRNLSASSDAFRLGFGLGLTTKAKTKRS